MDVWVAFKLPSQTLNCHNSWGRDKGEEKYPVIQPHFCLFVQVSDEIQSLNKVLLFLFPSLPVFLPIRLEWGTLNPLDPGQQHQKNLLTIFPGNSCLKCQQSTTPQPKQRPPGSKSRKMCLLYQMGKPGSMEHGGQGRDYPQRFQHPWERPKFSTVHLTEKWETKSRALVPCWVFFF